jgi:hypothetical protein
VIGRKGILSRIPLRIVVRNIFGFVAMIYSFVWCLF